MPAPLPKTKRAAIIADIKAGGTCRGIARKHEVSPGTVNRISRSEQLTDAFERSQTKKATEAAQVDHTAKLVAIASKSAGVAQDVIESLTILTPADWKRVSPYSRALIAGIMADKARELAPADDGADQVGSMLGKLLGQLTERHGAGD